jgi:6-phosphogluconolactonase (cycloisomerase 2 family)
MSMPTRRHFALTLVGLGIALAIGAVPARADGGPSAVRTGKVFTSTNAPAQNELLVYASDANGALSLHTRVATQGQGTGGGLGSQGAVTLSADGRFVFVVNAASNTLSTFELRGTDVVLTSVVDSGGLRPISVSEHNGIVYVLNALGSGNVAGFRNQNGALTPLADGVRGLSAAGGTGPAQVGFGADGDVLVVTEKATNRLTSYHVRRDGSLSQPIVTSSAGVTPFGFAFDRRDHLIVSEAFGGAVNASTASSYRFDEPHGATPLLVSGAVATQQTAACWVVVTPDGRFAYTGNAGSNSLSSFRISRSGAIELADPQAGSTGANAGVTDLAVSTDGRQLFALAPRSLQIVSFTVSHDGSLTAVGAGSGLPAGSVGLAAN